MLEYRHFGEVFMGLKADLPYPTMEGIAANACMLRAVSPAYAGREGEMTAILQYVYQSILLGACGEEETAGVLLSIAVTEMHHLQILGTLISKLGAPPVFTACPPYPVGYYSASCVNYAKSPAAMLEADLYGERKAVEEYRKMLGKLSDPRVSAVIERIIEDELVHIKTIENLIAKYRS